MAGSLVWASTAAHAKHSVFHGLEQCSSVRSANEDSEGRVKEELDSEAEFAQYVIIVERWDKAMVNNRVDAAMPPEEVDEEDDTCKHGRCESRGDGGSSSSYS